ncbi:MAG: carbamoylphosphate synthase large subunit [Firmicutes bacterium]|nr:carbamoylphosphate synthase large subunit [Bacillota bacterium]
MNFVFISPNFPRTYWNFCDRLKNNGANVLGVGDCPYDELDENLKRSLSEYYKVSSLENYDEVFRAVAFFSFKYGKIDWVESNNEYWLEQDARLRTDFNITTGNKSDDIGKFKSKSAMKAFYREAGVPSARNHRIEGREDALLFAHEVSYPVIVKPDVGVGAADTYKLSSDEDLDWFFSVKPPVKYVIEDFIEGDIYSYDAITNEKCEPLFESSTVFPPSIADIVNNGYDLSYYVTDKVPKKLRELGRATLKSFGVRSRFVHFEFFRLTKPHKGLGDTGDFVGLEVNMRPAGGYTPDMMNFAHSTDVYAIWADSVAYGERRTEAAEDDCFCVYSSRRDGIRYVHSHEDVIDRYGEHIVMCERMPDALSDAMGNQMYTAKCRTLDETKEFIRFVSERADGV